MAASFQSHLIQEKPAHIRSPHVQYQHETRPAATDASSQGSITITLPASPSVLTIPEPDSPGISSSSATPRQSRATHAARSPRIARSPAESPAPLSLRIPEKQPKSKGNSFLSFFSVKEPSQQAFEEYERRMRAKGPTGDGRTITGGISGVSSAKMPPSVPKVNSNWDGLPQVIKLKEKEKKADGQMSLGKYSRSISTAGSDGSKKTASSMSSSENSSLRSKPGFSRLDSGSGTGDLYGWESASIMNDSKDQFDIVDIKRDSRCGSMSSRRRKKMALSSHPVRPAQVPDDYLHTELPPLPSALENGSHGFSLPERESIPNTPAQSSSSTITSSEPSPVTPYGSSPVTCGSSRQLDHGTDQHHVMTTTLVIPDPGEVIIRSAGVEILDPPASARRKDKQPALFVQYEPGRFDPPDTLVATSQSEGIRLSDQGHAGTVSATSKESPVDFESGLRKKKRNKVPLFGK